MAEPMGQDVPRKMSLSDWNDHKDLIYRWYVREKLKAKEIIAELEHLGFQVAQWELKQRMSAWNMRKNLSRAEQNFVAAREAQAHPGSGRIDYQIAGQSIPRKRIQRLSYTVGRGTTLMAGGDSRQYYTY
ncbi:hypothetical protein B0I35DRAFT_440478 [Stachybotrys elegans]|uniref:Clr5 domain-containing protein n=1 Tax=Stachybotrys elegans TaxID=80388 RepID=A0A8K0SED1_9HYPO|nr:hypothetical protein B0I35DRAFT_440478 [Stachybotrys elegans]